VIVAVWVVATPEVVMVNVALVPPCGTVTDEGTEAAESFEERVTTTPPAGAGPFRVTVPVESEPPKTLVGETATEVRTPVAGITFSVVASWTPP
jgi:hypothetical protein